MRVNARVVLCRCQATKKIFGMRIEQMHEKTWFANWAFPIDEKRAKSEGFDKESLDIHCVIDENYPGCPYCHRTSYCQCGTCQKNICCDRNKDTSIVCPWCETKLYGFIKVSSMRFNAGMD